MPRPGGRPALTAIAGTLPSLRGAGRAPRLHRATSEGSRVPYAPMDETAEESEAASELQLRAATRIAAAYRAFAACRRLQMHLLESYRPESFRLKGGEDPADYGTIAFEAHGAREPSPYIRLSESTKIERVVGLVSTVWEVEHAQVVISLTGGAQELKLKPHVHDVFNRGLVRAAQQTNAWIVTGGTDTGVMKLVGEAVRDYQADVPCIGVATWGVIHGREQLEDNRGKEEFYYKMKANDPEGASLEPNHTHFLLVDTGKDGRDAWGGEIAFRTAFEQTYCKLNRVPMVLIVVGGGLGTLQTIERAAAHGVPIVLITDSGGAPALLSHYLKTKRVEFDPNGERSFKAPKNPAKVEKQVASIYALHEKHKVLTSFSTRQGETRNLDLVLLKAMLFDTDGNLRQTNLKESKKMLHLAIDWGRQEVVSQWIEKSAALFATSAMPSGSPARERSPAREPQHLDPSRREGRVQRSANSVLEHLRTQANAYRARLGDDLQQALQEALHVALKHRKADIVDLLLKSNLRTSAVDLVDLYHETVDHLTIFEADIEPLRRALRRHSELVLKINGGRQGQSHSWRSPVGFDSRARRQSVGGTRGAHGGSTAGGDAEPEVTVTEAGTLVRGRTHDLGPLPSSSISAPNGRNDSHDATSGGSRGGGGGGRGAFGGGSGGRGGGREGARNRSWLVGTLERLQRGVRAGVRMQSFNSSSRPASPQLRTRHASLPLGGRGSTATVAPRDEAEFFRIYSDDIVPFIARVCAQEQLLDAWQSGVVTGWDIDDIFIWAVLMTDEKLVHVLWRHVDEPIRMALVASHMTSKLASVARFDTERYERLASTYEGWAMGVLGQCDNELEARWLLQKPFLQPLPERLDSTLITLAIRTNRKGFVSHTHAQSLLDAWWRGDIVANYDKEVQRGVFCLSAADPHAGLVLAHALTFALFSIVKMEPTLAHRYGQLVDVQRWHQESRRPLDWHRLVRGQTEGASIFRQLQTVSEAVPVRASKCLDFFTAPKTKFYTRAFSYLCFLVLYAMVLLFDDGTPDVSITEALFFVWVVGLGVDELHQFVTNRRLHRQHFADMWNIIDAIMLALFFPIIFVMRVVAISRCCAEPSGSLHIDPLLAAEDAGCECHLLVSARVMLAVNAIFCYFRFLANYKVHPRLGVLIHVITGMITDVFNFVSILAYVLLGFAFAFSGLAPPRRLQWHSDSSSPLLIPLWNLYDLSDIEDVTDQSEAPALGMLLLAIYLFLSQILLINLLIAMMNSSYSEAHKNAEKEWASSRASSIEELLILSPWPPPLSTPILVRDLLRQTLCSTAGPRLDKPKQPARSSVEPSTLRRTAARRRRNVKLLHEYIEVQERARSESVESRVHLLRDDLDRLTNMVESASADRADSKAVLDKLNAERAQTAATVQSLWRALSLIAAKVGVDSRDLDSARPPPWPVGHPGPPLGSRHASGPPSAARKDESHPHSREDTPRASREASGNGATASGIHGEAPQRHALPPPMQLRRTPSSDSGHLGHQELPSLVHGHHSSPPAAIPTSPHSPAKDKGVPPLDHEGLSQPVLTAPCSDDSEELGRPQTAPCKLAVPTETLLPASAETAAAFQRPGARPAEAAAAAGGAEPLPRPRGPCVGTASDYYERRPPPLAQIHPPGEGPSTRELTVAHRPPPVTDGVVVGDVAELGAPQPGAALRKTAAAVGCDASATGAALAPQGACGREELAAFEASQPPAEVRGWEVREQRQPELSEADAAVLDRQRQRSEARAATAQALARATKLAVQRQRIAQAAERGRLMALRAGGLRSSRSTTPPDPCHVGAGTEPAGVEGAECAGPVHDSVASHQGARLAAPWSDAGIRCDSAARSEDAPRAPPQPHPRSERNAPAAFGQGATGPAYARNFQL